MAVTFVAWNQIARFAIVYVERPVFVVDRAVIEVGSLDNPGERRVRRTP
jgi:hypothetical protein